MCSNCWPFKGWLINHIIYTIPSWYSAFLTLFSTCHLDQPFHWAFISGLLFYTPSQLTFLLSLDFQLFYSSPSTPLALWCPPPTHILLCSHSCLIYWTLTGCIHTSTTICWGYCSPALTTFGFVSDYLSCWAAFRVWGHNLVNNMHSCWMYGLFALAAFDLSVRKLDLSHLCSSLNFYFLRFFAICFYVFFY